MLKYQVYLSTEENRTMATVTLSARYKLKINCGGLRNQELKRFLQIKIKDYVTRLEKAKIKLDPPEDLFDQQDTNSLIVGIPVDHKLRRGFAEKALPVVGHVSNVLAIIALGIVSYLAMRLTVGDKDNGTKIASFFGAIYTLIITFCIYVFSGASQGLALIGRKLDRIQIRQSNDNEYAKLIQPDDVNSQIEEHSSVEIILNSNANKVSTANILRGLGAGALVIINAGINSITTYQEVSKLGQASVKEDEEILREIVKVLPIVLIIAAGISNPAFQWGFIKSALEFATSCCSPKKQIEHEQQTDQKPIDDEAITPIVILSYQ